MKVPEHMKQEPAIVGGKTMDFTYGDCQKEMDMINRAFLETMLEGDSHELGFQYPQHFSRLFKKHVGCTPNEYKQRN